MGLTNGSRFPWWTEVAFATVLPGESFASFSGLAGAGLPAACFAVWCAGFAFPGLVAAVLLAETCFSAAAVCALFAAGAALLAAAAAGFAGDDALGFAALCCFTVCGFGVACGVEAACGFAVACDLGAGLCAHALAAIEIVRIQVPIFMASPSSPWRPLAALRLPWDCCRTWSEHNWRPRFPSATTRRSASRRSCRRLSMRPWS